MEFYLPITTTNSVYCHITKKILVFSIHETKKKEDKKAVIFQTIQGVVIVAAFICSS